MTWVGNEQYSLMGGKTNQKRLMLAVDRVRFKVPIESEVPLFYCIRPSHASCITQGTLNTMLHEQIETGGYGLTKSVVGRFC